MAHTELDLRERRLVEDLLLAKVPIARITVYREIGRNRFGDDELPELNGYYAVLAQRKAAERRRRQRKLFRMPELLAAVVDRLQAGRSPAGSLNFDSYSGK